MKDSRRHFIKKSALLGAALSLGEIHVRASLARPAKTKYPDETAFLFRRELEPFYHGVASGDPLQNAVIIWTRLTPEHATSADVSWEVALDASFNQPVARGSIVTDSARDYTVKVDVKDLQPDTYYFYRFGFEGKRSVTGRTKTLPAGMPGQANLIAVSCNAYEGGYFNAYRKIAERKERIDAVLHLGDYIYEDFLPQFIKLEDRVPLPEKRIVTLQDYRTRYAQYRLDADLQMAHRRHPFIHIWDDHEIANDAYAGGAEGHDPEKDGDFDARKKRAIRTFYEWVPVRESRLPCYRSFSLGGLADLFMLDERTGRSEPGSFNSPDLSKAGRVMLDEEQFRWLTGKLKTSSARWKLIGNQVLFCDVNFAPVLPPDPKRKLDNWSGYPYQRNRLVAFFKEHDLKNIVLLSGDSHSSWAFDVVDFSQNPVLENGRAYAVEIGVPAISSGNWGDFNPAAKVKNWEEQLLRSGRNRHLRYVDLSTHGYVHLQLTPDIARADWYTVDKYRRGAEEEILSKRMLVRNGLASIG